MVFILSMNINIITNYIAILVDTAVEDIIHHRHSL